MGIILHRHIPAFICCSVLCGMTGLKHFARRLYDLVPFKQPVYTVLRALVKVPESIHKHLHFKGVITVPISPTEKFRIMHHGYMIENELFWQGFGGFEKISIELWARLCRRCPPRARRRRTRNRRV